jgi:D-alanine transfer protein
MLNFPEPLQDKSFIKFSLEKLAGDSFVDRLLYHLAWPLARLQIAVLRTQDHYATVDFMRHNLSAEVVNITRAPQEIDWDALVPVAEQEQITNTDSNPFGVDNSQWPKIKELFEYPVEPGSKDAEFIQDVELAREWDDLDLALRVMKELNVNAVIMSNPMNTPLWEIIGVSEQAQNTYYEKLHEVVNPYGFPVVDFHEYQNEPYFSMDLASHASRKGWIYVNEALDRIYHHDLP